MTQTSPAQADHDDSAPGGSTDYQRLRPGARLLLDDRFLSGESAPNLAEHEEACGFDHGFDAELLQQLLTEAMDRGRAAGSSRPATDAWLAPRLHAVLRLRRSEAANNGLWFWLAATHGREYVSWRWPATVEGKSLKRYTGGDRDNAFSRLWWTAELFRNGGDYSTAVEAFSLQDITSTWVVLDAVHHPAVPQAALAMINSWAGTEGANSSKRSNRLATVLNHHLTTVMLDAVAPSPGPDAGAAEEWVHGHPEKYEIFDQSLPPGPEEDPVESSAIAAVSALLQRVAEQEGIDLSK